LRALRERGALEGGATGSGIAGDAAASAIWRRIAPIPAELEGLAREAHDAADAKSPAGDSPASIAAEVARLAQAVGRFDARYRPLLGEPTPPSDTPALATGGAAARDAASGAHAYYLNGQVAAGGGNARFRPLNLAGAAQESGTLEFQMRGGLRPTPSSNLAFNLARTRRVEQIALANTDVGLTFDQTVSARLTARAEASYSGYAEEDSDARDFGEARLRASGRYRLAPATGFDLAYGLERRGHAETEAADYSTQRVDGALRHRTERLRAEATMSLQNRSAETAAAGFSRREPGVLIETGAAGRAPTGVAASLETYEFRDDPAASSNRLRAEAYVGRGRDAKLGARYVRFDRADAGDSSAARGYADVAVYSAARAADRRGTAARDASLTYRNQRSATAVDYADVTLHRRRSVRGAWLPRRELSLATRYFLNKDGLATESHSADLAALLGWDFAAPARAVVGVDALFGGRAFVDPDRARHQDLAGGAVYDPTATNNFNPDDDRVWANPRNTARFGGAVRVARSNPAGLSLDARVKYERSVLYNADPVTSRSDVGLDVTARYPVRPAWVAEATLSTYRSRSAMGSSPTDFDRSKVQIRATYLFDLSGGPAR